MLLRYLFFLCGILSLERLALYNPSVIRHIRHKTIQKNKHTFKPKRYIVPKNRVPKCFIRSFNRGK